MSPKVLSVSSVEDQVIDGKICCPHCDALNESNAEFCANCGNVLY